MLVSGGRDGVVKMWDVQSFGSIGSVRAHSDTVNDISSNNTHLFTASRYATVFKYICLFLFFLGFWCLHIGQGV